MVRGAELRRLRDDVSAFGAFVGWPLTAVQAGAMALETRETVLVAPRQTGKSYCLGVLSCWWAFRKPGQRVLIVSAGEDAARRLLGTVRAVAASQLLAGSVLDESASLVVLSNGSEIRSVPASERQIRGWSADLLVVDEAALVADDVLVGAALPTTAARRDARVVLASSPWGPSGYFHRRAVAGVDPANGDTRTVRWRVEDAPWVSGEAVAHARASMPPARFRAEYLAEFVGASDLFFDRDEVLGAVAGYRLLPSSDARGGAVCVGCDWGRAVDAHAVVLVGVLEDLGRNPEPVLFVPWLEASRRPYADQVALVSGLARRRVASRGSWWDFGFGVDSLPGGLTLHESGSTLPVGGGRAPTGFDVVAVLTEANGVGAWPSEELAGRMRGVHVESVHSSQRSKEDAYGRLRALISSRRLVLPDNDGLLRELLGLTCEATPSGGLSIAAGPDAQHDDLADALSLAVTAASERLSPGARSDRGLEVDTWVSTPSGVDVPYYARPRVGALRTGSPISAW